MEIKNGIIIDGVLHEAVNYSNDSYCSICSLRKECDELENRCDEWICRLIDCRYFVNRGKVTDIKIDKYEKGCLSIALIVAIIFIALTVVILSYEL